MIKKYKKILFIGGAFLLLIQLYQPVRNQSSEQDETMSFTSLHKAPKNIKGILRISCYDCHSNNTNYPWYSYIQPTRFLMEYHIKRGKENLNFDEWGNYGRHKQSSKLDRIIKEIKESNMPLSSYTLIHKNAILTTVQKAILINFLNNIRDE